MIKVISLKYKENIMKANSDTKPEQFIKSRMEALLQHYRRK